jgi:hypothetical protein
VSPQADINFERELRETAVTLRSAVAPATSSCGWTTP